MIQTDKQVDFSEKLHPQSNVKKVIGVVSGKGGVGKSLVTSLLAVTMQRRQHRVAILDADITGPSIPKAFGLTERASGTELGLLPVKSKTGIDIMSINLLLENDTDPVVWRGPIIAGTVKQFWSEVIWSDIDYMFVDMPPGTGDVPLTVFQSLPVDGIIVVASPQELVSMIVAKAVNMARMMNIPVLGLVENMSYFACPNCEEKYPIFGESRIDETAKEYGLDVIAKIPVDPRLASVCDRGMVELFIGDWFDSFGEKLDGNENLEEEVEESKMKIAVASEDNQVTQHFGHCESFMVYDVEGSKIVKSETIANPGHRPGFLPNFLNDMGVNVIISGGMGGGAIDIFNEKGIQVVTGAKGESQKVAEDFIGGNLVSTGSVCRDHQHESSCH
jgi:Mrp family chromosome partitioning ATPase/predicted Fe-Mo cluster-binding NifX family protein